MGLVRKENTPCRVASTASGMEPWAVMMITGTALFCRRSASNSARPSMPGMRRSVSTTSGLKAVKVAGASSPLLAAATS